jgi:riboflavin kinase/FMN adenylyltransferase
LARIGAIVALGFFDGVHLGHQSIIQEMFKPQYSKLTPTVFTYEITTVQPQTKQNISLIISNKQKLEKLKLLGVEKVISLNFKEFFKMHPNEFFQQIIIDKLNAKVLVCGENFKFGYKRTGDINLMQKFCKQKQLQLIVKPLLKVNETIISSSLIRNLMQNNHQEAEKFLKYQQNLLKKE